MRTDLPTSARREFARSAAFRHEQERFFREVEKKQKDERVAERTDGDLSDLVSAAVLASEIEITEFRGELDLYRTATTQALMENERQLAEVQSRLDAMLARAHVLPDGRRVFKTKDGLRVFDEHGIELSADEIDPSVIEDWRPPANDYLADLEDKLDLLSDRKDLLTYEERIDLAEERAKSDQMTQDELKEFRADLEASMPMAVREIARPETMPARELRQDFTDASQPTPRPSLKAELDELGFNH